MGWFCTKAKAWRALLARTAEGSCPHVVVAGSINQPVGDLGIAVDAAVTQERPVAADLFYGAQVDFGYQNLFFVVGSFSDDTAKRVAEERGAPEFQAISRSRFAADVSGFVSYAIYHRHVNAVGDGVGALNGTPGVVLGLAKLGFLRRMPANGCGVELDLSAL